MKNPLIIFSGNSNPTLSNKVCRHLRAKLGRAEVSTFAGGEIKVQLLENVRGADVFIIQSICATPVASPNDALMELLVLIDAARRSSAERITAVLPYFGYARQERKDRPRVPITAKLVCNMIVEAGADRILTMDLHSKPIQGFVDIPFDHLYSINIFGARLKTIIIPHLVVVSPDAGSIKMTRAYAELLDAPIAIIDKRHESGQEAEVMNVIGDVVGKNALLVDDLTSTAGTIVNGADALKKRGAKSVRAIIVHPVMVEDEKLNIHAVQAIESSSLKEVFVSDSIHVPSMVPRGKIKILSAAPLLSEAIRRIHQGKSVSALFANTNVEG